MLCSEEGQNKAQAQEQEADQKRDKKLFLIPKRLYLYRNVHPTEIYTQKRLGTVKMHLYIGEMFQMCCKRKSKHLRLD